MLDALPADVVFQIARALGVRDGLRMASSCKRIRGLAREKPWWTVRAATRARQTRLLQRFRENPDGELVSAWVESGQGRTTVEVERVEPLHRPDWGADVDLHDGDAGPWVFRRNGEDRPLPNSWQGSNEVCPVAILNGGTEVACVADFDDQSSLLMMDVTTSPATIKRHDAIPLRGAIDEFAFTDDGKTMIVYRNEDEPETTVYALRPEGWVRTLACPAATSVHLMPDGAGLLELRAANEMTLWVPGAAAGPWVPYPPFQLDCEHHHHTTSKLSADRRALTIVCWNESHLIRFDE